jgi:hypothetical protein
MLATNSVFISTKSNKKCKRPTSVPILEMKLNIAANSEVVN